MLPGTKAENDVKGTSVSFPLLEWPRSLLQQISPIIPGILWELRAGGGDGFGLPNLMLTSFLPT